MVFLFFLRVWQNMTAALTPKNFFSRHPVDFYFFALKLLYILIDFILKDLAKSARSLGVRTAVIF